MKIKEQLQSTADAVSGTFGNYAEKLRFPTWLPKNSTARSFSLAVLFLISLCAGAFVSTRWLDFSGSTSITGNGSKKLIFGGISFKKHPPDLLVKNNTEFPLDCWPANITKKCPSNYYPSNYSSSSGALDQTPQPQPACPDYFRWIHHDLWPWRETGITLEMVEAAKAMDSSQYRLIVVNGKAYLQQYRGCFQTRDVFTQWGILQLLRLYPGQIPDLDMVFNCGDHPAVPKETYPKPNAQAPPPLFSYDVSHDTTDIVLPDWSFWGWPEVNIKPWEMLSWEIKEENEKMKWKKREPHAYWKGNPNVSPSRWDLLKCNVSKNQDWNARLYIQDWIQETRQGFKTSNLATQCKHRFKIYIEGRSWSVSMKYIFACDSPTLVVNPHYDHFFSRSLMPLEHYWPIRENDKCRSIKYAVDWGNRHQKEAQAIGKAASKFTREEVGMKFVYDYMFHLLTEYGKLLTYTPVVPKEAVELCSESMACPAQGLIKEYLTDTVVAGPSDVPPCTLPPPYDPAALHSFLERKKKAIIQVETWEKQYWDTQKKN